MLFETKCVVTLDLDYNLENFLDEDFQFLMVAQIFGRKILESIFCSFTELETILERISKEYVFSSTELKIIHHDRPIGSPHRPMQCKHPNNNHIEESNLGPWPLLVTSSFCNHQWSPSSLSSFCILTITPISITL